MDGEEIKLNSVKQKQNPSQLYQSYLDPKFKST